MVAGLISQCLAKRRAGLPQDDHRPGLAQERFAGEVRGLHVVVFAGEDQV
jgi:hypothetical protein